MDVSRKFLGVKNNNKNVSRIDYCIARSCLATVLIGSVLFNAPVSARKIIKSETENVFFPQKPFPTSKDEAYKSMFALARGRLELKNGCLRLKEGKVSFLLIWPGRYGLEVKNNTLIIKDVYAGLEPEIRVKLNSEVTLGGGGLPDGYVPDADMLVQPLPKGCTGPYWSVGSIEPKSKVKNKKR